MFLQQPLFHTPESLSVISFIADVWPLMLISLSFSAFVFFCWYFGFALQKHKKKQNLWITKNEGAIEQYKDLQLHLKDFGQQISCCKNCSGHEMQLWGCQQKLLVVRCRSCKMNYTFSKEHNQLILQIQLVKELLSTLIFYRNDTLGKLLAHKLGIDITSINYETIPLEIIHFATANAYTITPKSVMDILIFEYEVVFPEQSELLAC